MSISENLAAALHALNNLVPHREESTHIAVRDAINAEMAADETPADDKGGAHVAE